MFSFQRVGVGVGWQPSMAANEAQLQHAIAQAALTFQAFVRAQGHCAFALSTAVPHLHTAWTVFQTELPEGTTQSDAWKLFEQVFLCRTSSHCDFLYTTVIDCDCCQEFNGHGICTPFPKTLKRFVPRLGTQGGFPKRQLDGRQRAFFFDHVRFCGQCTSLKQYSRYLRTYVWFG